MKKLRELLGCQAKVSLKEVLLTGEFYATIVAIDENSKGSLDVLVAVDKSKLNQDEISSDYIIEEMDMYDMVNDWCTDEMDGDIYALDGTHAYVWIRQSDIIEIK